MKALNKAKHKPISTYGWCVACDGVGPIWPTFAGTRKDAIAKFEDGGSPLKFLPNYCAVKVYIATAKA